MFEGSLVYRASQGNTQNPCLEKQKTNKREREEEEEKKEKKEKFLLQGKCFFASVANTSKQKKLVHQIKDTTVELTDLY